MTQPNRASRGSAALARRLRELREHSWPDQPVTQRQLAEAFGGLSVATISGYENEKSPTTPPRQRLRSYATFFASRRSMDDGQGHVIAESDLDPAERVERDRLLAEFRSLAAGKQESPGPDNVGVWTFPDNEPIRIVCGHLTDMTHPYADPSNVNYTELLTVADVDALLELWGHLWRLNPTCDIRFLRTDQLLKSDDLGSHLVLLGNGFNPKVQQIVSMTDLPLSQVSDEALVEDGEVFMLDDDKSKFLPKITVAMGLTEDVGLLARLRNPYNSARSLTLCSGVFSRGVYGAVRSLTYKDSENHNEAYLIERFAGEEQFAILMRVKVLMGSAVTPDLENPDDRLWEWSGSASEGVAETGDRGTGER